MAVDINSFNNFQRGKPSPVLKSKVDNKSLDYWSRLQPYIGIQIDQPPAVVKDILRAGMIIAFKR